MSAASELEKIAREVAVCTKCDLCRTRTNTVPGEGSSTARVMFIGEAPGFHEDQQGRPFVGQSGQLLNKLLEGVKLPRAQVFISNVVKCHPPQNLDPTPEQMAACKPYLDRQIAAINPRLVITLGRFSMARYWPGQRISQIHGQVKQADGRLYLPMFHPSAALRDRDRTLPMFKADGFKIPALLEKAEEAARNEIWGYPVDEPPEAAPVSPLVVAESSVPFNAQTAPTSGEDGPAPFVAPVASTLQAESPANSLNSYVAAEPEVVTVTAQEIVPAPEKVKVRVKRVKTVPNVEPAGEILPAIGDEIPLYPNGMNGEVAADPVTLNEDVAPGLALSEAGQGGTARQGRNRSGVPKLQGEPAKLRKKRPTAPGEQLSMF